MTDRVRVPGRRLRKSVRHWEGLGGCSVPLLRRAFSWVIPVAGAGLGLTRGLPRGHLGAWVTSRLAGCGDYAGPPWPGKCGLSPGPVISGVLESHVAPSLRPSGERTGLGPGRGLCSAGPCPARPATLSVCTRVSSALPWVSVRPLPAGLGPVRGGLQLPPAAQVRVAPAGPWAPLPFGGPLLAVRSGTLWRLCCSVVRQGDSLWAAKR